MANLRDVMSTPAVSARVDTPLVAAIRLMHQRRVGSVVIVDGVRPVGIVTERDVLGAVDDGDLADLKVSEVMSAPVDTVAVDQPLQETLQTMRERGYRHLPVVEHDELVGVVSLRDLARIATIDPPEIPRGLRGVVVTDTEVGDVRGEEGFYHYRQYSAIDLAERRSFEDVARLLVDGALPASHAERDAFAAELAAAAAIPPAVQRALEPIATTTEPYAGLLSAVPLIAAHDGMGKLVDIDAATRRRDAIRLIAVVPALLTALHRLRAGLRPVEPRPELGYAANYLWLLHGEEPSPERAAAIERYLIATVDHGFNASTFTARVVASTAADFGSCITGALAALSGPLHGGAPSRALDLLDEIRSVDNVDTVIRPMIENGERIMGFGHAVYRTDDPRSLMLRTVAENLGGPTAALAVAVERHIVELLEELKPGRRLYPNVEFYAGVVMEQCGIPRSMFTPTFATSRVVGWSANILEQAADGRLIRPAARYVGAPPPQPVPAP
jgi:citrate synthase